MSAIQLKARFFSSDKEFHLTSLAGGVEIKGQLAVLLLIAEVQRNNIDLFPVEKAYTANLALVQNPMDFRPVRHLTVPSAHLMHDNPSFPSRVFRGKFSQFSLSAFLTAVKRRKGHAPGCHARPIPVK